MTVTIGDASYQVIWKPNGTAKDITAKIISIDRCKFVANEHPTAIINLDAGFGGFITDADVGGSGETPIIDELQEIKVKFTDKNDATKSKIFYVDDFFPKRIPGSNLILEVHLIARQSYLSYIPAGKKQDFEDAFTVTKDLIDIANDNNGTLQPDIEDHDDATANTLPKWTANNWRFSDKEYMVWDALLDTVNGMGASIANKGAGDFYGIRTVDKSSDETKLEIIIKPSGSTPASPITVTDSNTTPLKEIKGQVQPKTGTIIGAWLVQGSGSLPPEFAEFRSIVEEFQLIPDHQSGLTYPSGTFVHLNGTVYKANTETSQTPPHANWTATLISASDFLGTKQYSPWTEDKASLWKNSGTNPIGAGTGVDLPGCWDSNLVVLDEDHYRNRVDVKQVNPANVSVFYKYGAASGGNYRGLRVLCNGTGVGDFSGTDKNGNAYTNALVQHDGAEWVVIGPIGDSGIRAAATDDLCGIEGENKVYKFNGTTWVDDSATARANDCFHVYHSISNAQGISELSDGGGSNYGATSAVKYAYRYSSWSAIASSIFTDPNYYNIGCWANFSTPFPKTTHNSITEDLGELFGGDSTKKEPATLNTDNMDLTPTGQSGFNKSDSKALGPLETLDFVAKFNWFIVALGETLGQLEFQGNFKMRAFCYDTSDNVVAQDFVIEHINHYEQISLELGQFKTYRARAPLRWGNVLSNLIRPELEVLNVFEWKNLCKIGIQLQEVYDDEGRYKPQASRFVTVPALSGEMEIDLYLDAWRLGKQHLSLTPTVSDFPKYPPFMNLDMSNTRQGDQAVLGQLDIEQHRYRAYTSESEILCNIDEEDSFYLVDNEIISDNDDSSGGVKLVAREVDYTVNSRNGPGGIRRKVLGVKRLT